MLTACRIDNERSITSSRSTWLLTDNEYRIADDVFSKDFCVHEPFSSGEYIEVYKGKIVDIETRGQTVYVNGGRTSNFDWSQYDLMPKKCARLNSFKKVDDYTYLIALSKKQLENFLGSTRLEIPESVIDKFEKDGVLDYITDKAQLELTPKILNTSFDHSDYSLAVRIIDDFYLAEVSLYNNIESKFEGRHVFYMLEKRENDRGRNFTIFKTISCPFGSIVIEDWGDLASNEDLLENATVYNKYYVMFDLEKPGYLNRSVSYRYSDCTINSLAELIEKERNFKRNIESYFTFLRSRGSSSKIDFEIEYIIREYSGQFDFNVVYSAPKNPTLPVLAFDRAFEVDRAEDFVGTSNP